MSGPDVTPKTESGRALLRDLRGSMYERLTDERTGTPIILAIEQEAASKAVAGVREVRITMWDGEIVVIAVSEDDPGDMGEPRDFMADGVRYVTARALIASERKP